MDTAVDGFALHRAFIDGGEIKSGFFRDKYGVSNNDSIASSLHFKEPLSSSSSVNSIYQINEVTENQNHIFMIAAKSRSADHFASSIFIHKCLALLSEAHAQAATSDVFCVWCSSGNTNFPELPLV